MAQGGLDFVKAIGHTGDLINSAYSVDDSTPEERAGVQKHINSLYKGAQFGISDEVSQGGTPYKALNIAGDLARIAPAILTSESTGGASFYLQGVGQAAKQVDDMEANGMTFKSPAIKELYIQGRGLINLALGKSVVGTLFPEGSGLTNDVVSSLSADVTKELANKVGSITSEDIANAYTTKALDFIQRTQEVGLGVLKRYPIVATEFAGANVANVGLNAAVNKLNTNAGGDTLFNENSKLSDVPGAIGEAIYNNDTPANGNPLQGLVNVLTSPAGGFSALHGVMQSGMIFNSSPYKNVVVESLQKDSSPANIAKIKDQLISIGKEKGWSVDEINKTQQSVDALADIAGKIPSDIAPGKFRQAIDIILGRRTMEEVLSQTDEKAKTLDPAFTDNAEAFKNLVTARIEQANDHLTELVKEKKFTFSTKEGKYYKTFPGGEPEEITKDRYDLEKIDKEASKPDAGPVKGLGDAEPSKPSAEPSKPSEPTPPSSELDELDSELEGMKQPEAPVATTEAQALTDETKPAKSEITPDNSAAARVSKETLPTELTIDKTSTTEPVVAKKATSESADVTPFINEVADPIKPNSAQVASMITRKDGSKVALVVAKSQTGDDIAAIREIDKNGKAVLDTRDNGWKTPFTAKKYFDALTNKKEEPSNDEQLQAGQQGAVGQTPEKPAEETKPGKEVQGGNEAQELRPAAEGHGLSEKPTKGERLLDTKKNKAVTINRVFKPEKGSPLENEPYLVDLTHEDGSKAINIPASRLAKLPNDYQPPYYIAKQGEGGKVTHEETAGTPVPNDAGLDLFVHPREDDFAVSEGSTGLKIADGATEKEAIANAHQFINTRKPFYVNKLIEAQYNKGIKSPRGRVEKPSENLSKPSKPSGKLDETISDLKDKGVNIGKYTMPKEEAGAKALSDTFGKNLSIGQEREFMQSNKEYRDLVQADEDGTIDEAGRDRMSELYKAEKKRVADLTPPAEPKPKYTGPKRIVEFGKNKEPYIMVGKNSEGEEVFENSQGRRARQKVGGVVTEEPEGENRGQEYTTTDEPQPEQPKSEKEQRQADRDAKKAKVKEKLDAAKKAFIDSINKATSGIDPETLAKGLKMMKVYAEAGILKFREIAEDLAEDLGENLRDVWDALKSAYLAYGAHATDAELDEMDNMRDVRNANIDDYLNTENDNRSEHDTLDENSSGVAPGERAGEPAGNVPAEQPAEVLGGKNDRSGKTGAKPAKQEPDNEPGPDRQPGGGSDISAGTGRADRGTDTGTGTDLREDRPQRTVKPEDRNHVIERGDTIVPDGEVGKLNANIDAILLLKKLETEDRNPTPAEKKQLAQFVGWGGLAKYLSANDYKSEEAVNALLQGKVASVYNQSYQRINLNFTDAGPLDMTKSDNFGDLVKKIQRELQNSGYSITPEQIRAPLLKNLLSNAEYQDAVNSTINAHYTERSVINKMWDIVEKLGFKGGRVLEPSAGIGHFFGLLPENLRNKTALQAYELDSLTGRMLKKLYPQANITVGGFENSRVAQNSVDLAISNVPFAQSAPYDKSFPDLSKFSMHNYFIAKNLKLLKPGGVAVMITSASTMDSPSSARFREWVTSPEGGNSYLVGAIRLPNNAFSENAGTQVTTDMLVFQKKGVTVNPDIEQPFRYTKFLKTGLDREGDSVDLHINEYYHDHPEQMLGDMMTAHEAGSGGLYGSDNATLKAPAGMDINKELNKAADALPKGIYGDTAVPVKTDDDLNTITASDKKEGSLFSKGDKIYRVQDGDGVPMTMDAKQKQLATAYIDVKDGLLNLIRLELSNVNAEANIDAQRKELNKAYDQFVKKHGYINGRSTQFIADADIDFPIVSSLETISRHLENVNGKDKIVQTISKGEILAKRINYPRVEPTVASDLKDAVNISLNYRSGLDINYMARMLKEDPETLRDRLISEQQAFENPDTGILETPEEYLSGLVREKLRKAEAATVNDPKYKNNVAELKKVVPEDIPSSMISYSLGSSWIPDHVYEDFAKQIFGGARVGVKYIPQAGKYLTTAGYGTGGAEVMNTYAAGGLNGVEILDATLNNRQIIVSDTIKDIYGSTRTVRNVEKTAAAQGMQATLQDEFNNYIQGNEPVQHETERIYNDVFNGQVLRDFRIPEFKHYPGASTTINLREHQKRAVSRGLSESTLFAHEVGSGKTYTIITTAMEMRRLGTARKPMIGVQNSTLGDFVADFKKLYPGAKLLAPSEKEMEADGRKKLFAKIATGDWDAIILPHSQITMIPDDPERQKAYILEQIDEMKATMASMSDKREKKKIETEIKNLEKEMAKLEGDAGDEEGGKGNNAKSVAKRALNIKAGMEKALDRKVDNILNFEQLGVDALLMDEAHKYKRLGFQTNMQNIKGIDTSKSQRSQSVLLKSRWIQEKTGGKNVNFYTGTPISNTMAEAWTMMKYLRPDLLQHLGIEYFDQFAKTFGQVIPSLEQTGGGTFKVQNRFAKFQNLPEFINAFRTVTDVVLSEDVKEFQNTNTIPKLKNGGFTQVILPQSPELKAQIQEFKKTLEWFDNLSGKEKRENSHIPLVIYNKAKQASIDLRLLDPTNVDSPQSKVNVTVEMAYNFYKETMATKGVQMIFSDMYQSPEPKNRFLDEDGMVVNPAFGKDRFHLFEDIKKKLVAKGVPADEIVIFTEPKYDKADRKKAVFADANSGKIRFLLGTTEKMGVGVNAQKKLAKLFHLDAPARPMDFEQRNGRIIRQGNENSEVEVITLGVEKTLDSSAFQRLSTKKKFINQVMKGNVGREPMEDPADEAQVTFDEMMAHLSDSPFAMQKLLVDNKLSSERMKENNFRQKLIRTNSQLRINESELRSYRSRVQDEVRHAEIVRDKFPDNNITSLQVGDQPEATEKFGDAADVYIKKLLDMFDHSPTKYAKGAIKLNGVRVELEINNDQRMSKETSLMYDHASLAYTIPEIGLLTDRWGTKLIIPSNGGQGLMSSIRSQLDNTLIKPAETQHDILKAEKNIETLKKDAATKFDDTRLKELEKESESLREKMLAEKKDTAPAAPQSDSEYILDQSNIKGALDFLDGMKAKGGGNNMMGMLVPIPPAVWNGAIDVMKGVLKATNSTQKALRVAGRYIVNKGGSAAQAADFTQSMTDTLATTKFGMKATAPDTDEVLSNDQAIKAATEIQNKLKNTLGLSPDEKALMDVDLSQLDNKTLHRYIEVGTVLSVDPNGVTTTEVNDLYYMAGEPPMPPEPPAGDLPEGEDDDEPKNKIPKKEVGPMSSEDDEELTVNPERPTGVKKNYSLLGNLWDIHVRNLSQLKIYSKDIENMDSLRKAIKLATSKSQSKVDLVFANDKIKKLIGEDGYLTMRQALIESRLRGTRQRWADWAQQIRDCTDNDIDDLFSEGTASPLYKRLDGVQGYEDDMNPPATILTMIDNGDYDGAREYMSEMFDNAANNVAYYDKLANGKTFDEMVGRNNEGKFEFKDAKYEQAHQVYKQYIETPFKESHETNEGVFSDALGPLNTYYPLTRAGEDAPNVYFPTKSKYNAPDNINNHFTSGQADQYTAAITELSKKLSASIKTNNKADFINAIQEAGLVSKITADDNPFKPVIRISGIDYEATKVPVSDARTITTGTNSVHIPVRYVLIPTFLYKEIKPFIEGDEASDDDKYSIMGYVLNTAVNLMLGGPGEAISHTYRLLAAMTNSMPFMQEWAYKNGVLGHAGGIVANNILVKKIVGMGKILFTNTGSEEFANDVMEMAKMGLIPEKTWTHTWSKEFAKSMGIEPTQFPLPFSDIKEGLLGKDKKEAWKRVFTKGRLFDFSPVLYGKNGFDLKARVTMYRLVKAMNPEATPEQHVKMQADMGQYTQALQGRIEKFIKRNGLAPFATFGRAFKRAGLKAIIGASPIPLDSPDFKEFFNGNDKGANARKFMFHKLAQLITNGILGYMALWVLWHKEVTDKWPWEDPHSKMSKLPMPEWAKQSDFAKKYFFNKRTGQWDDIDMSFFNIPISRGVKATGVENAYNTWKRGGTLGQSVESGEVGIVNGMIQPYANSPLISIPWTTATGTAPFVTDTRQKMFGKSTGKFEVSFLKKTNTQAAGMQMPANFYAGAMGMNPLLEQGLNPVTGSVVNDYNEDDYESGKFLKSLLNIGLPGLTTAHGDDKKAMDRIKNDAAAIPKAIAKEHKK